MRHLSTFVFASAMAFTAAACGGGQQAGPPPAFPPTPVTLAAAQAGRIDDATEYVATLKSLRSTTVQPQAEGQITQIFVKSGDAVAQGAPVAQIDSRRQQAAVASQQAELGAREAAVNYMRQQAERVNDLFKSGAASRQELETAQTSLQTAEANLKSLQAQLQQGEVQLRYFTVTAPTAGVVGDVPVRVGNQVTSQTVLTTIDQNSTLELYVNVPVEHGPELHIGLPVEVLNGDSVEPLATTKVSFVSPHVDDQTQSILAKAVVPNPGGLLRPLQYVRARVIWKSSEGLVIPVTAVVRISGQVFAFVAEQGEGGKLVARQRAIKVGSIEGNDYPVLEGIKAGERVVTSGAQKLADGAPIQEQPAIKN